MFFMFKTAAVEKSLFLYFHHSRAQLLDGYGILISASPLNMRLLRCRSTFLTKLLATAKLNGFYSRRFFQTHM